MSRELVTLTLQTQPTWAKVRYNSLNDALTPQRPTLASFDTVTGIVDPDGVTHTNPNHYSQSDTFTLFPEEGSAGITIEEEKAARIVAVFRSLRPGHLLECHDLVAVVEDQPEDATLDGHFLYTPDESIESGSVYCVMAHNKQNLYRTHSGYGTDDQRLLGLMGKGLALSIFDPETARKMYGSGLAADVCQPIPWAMAA